MVDTDTDRSGRSTPILPEICSGDQRSRTLSRGEPRVVEDPGTHAGEPARLVGALRGRCPVAASRADPERVPAHLPADGRPVPARRPCDVGLAPALVPHQHDLLALRQCRMCVPAHASSDVWLSVASTIVSVTHGPLPFPAVALEMKIHVSKWRSYSDTLRDSTPIPSCSNFKRF